VLWFLDPPPGKSIKTNYAGGGCYGSQTPPLEKELTCLSN